MHLGLGDDTVEIPSVSASGHDPLCSAMNNAYGMPRELLRRDLSEGHRDSFNIHAVLLPAEVSSHKVQHLCIHHVDCIFLSHQQVNVLKAIR